MQSENEPGLPNRSIGQSENEPVNSSHTSGGASSAGEAGPRHYWTWALPAVLVAGLGAWFVGESSLNVFVPTAKEAENDVRTLVIKDNSLHVGALRRVKIHNAALHEGILGAAVSLALGLSAGLARRSLSGSLLGGLCGLILGGAATGLTAMVLFRLLLAHFHYEESSLLLPFLVHMGIWCTLGVMCGVSASIGFGGNLKRIATTAIGGGIGAIIGTFLFEVLYAILFPLARLDSLVAADATSRLLACLLIPISIAVGVTWSSPRQSGSHATPRGPLTA